MWPHDERCAADDGSDELSALFLGVGLMVRLKVILRYPSAIVLQRGQRLTVPTQEQDGNQVTRWRSGW